MSILEVIIVMGVLLAAVVFLSVNTPHPEAGRADTCNDTI